MDLPAGRAWLGDAQTALIEPLKRRLDGIAPGPRCRRRDRFAILPGGIDSSGESGIGHRLRPVWAEGGARTMGEAARRCQPRPCAAAVLYDELHSNPSWLRSSDL